MSPRPAPSPGTLVLVRSGSTSSYWNVGPRRFSYRISSSVSRVALVGPVRRAQHHLLLGERLARAQQAPEVQVPGRVALGLGQKPRMKATMAPISSSV